MLLHHLSVMLECRNIQKHYGGVVAVRDVSWRVERGEVHALCGENGAGKSSLARIVAGITAPDGGEVLLDGQPVVWSGPQQAREAGVSIILQELDLFAHLSIAENLALGNPKLEKSRWVSRAALHEAVRPLLKDVGLDLDPALPLETLSVSHWQLVAIARVLGIDAKIILMDEPTSALTDDAVERLFGLIARLKARGVSIVYVSHKMDEIFRICDRVSVMRDGAMIGTQKCSDTTIDQVIQQMVGRAVQVRRGTHAAPKEAAPVLELAGVSTRKLTDISFSLRPGEILGVAGLVASGRSELGRMLFGLSPVTAGMVKLAGQPYAPHDPSDALAHGVALVPEDRQREGLFPMMSIRHNATLASVRKFSRADWIDGAREKAASDEALRRCNTKLAHDELPVSALSGGNQQKVLIGKWLMTGPKVCFFDDPTRGIDIGAKDDIYKLLAQLAGEGLGVIWVSSELPELLANAHRILVLYEGRAMGILDAAGAAQEDIMRLATAHPQLIS
jgi:ABC-type sugar transport system ATPase subunit